MHHDTESWNTSFKAEPEATAPSRGGVSENEAAAGENEDFNPWQY
jgi:hypothetical protein